jgi:protein-S-isoprenylcysteine O-methyltransferase Ste14
MYMSTKNEMAPQELKSLVKNIVVKFSLIPLFMCALLLLPAGTLKFWQVYAYFAVLIVPMIFVILYFLKKDPMFLKRRMSMREKEKQQKSVVLTSTVFFAAGFLIPGLDHRFAWSNVPTYMVITADIIVLSAYLFIFYVFSVNSYASRIIEVVESQKVISTGPYGVVRHPMYSGVLVMYLFTPLALGSYWAIIPFLFLPVTFVFRILNEEKVLSNNLQGYTEYCQKTRFRLIPFIW